MREDPRLKKIWEGGSIESLEMQETSHPFDAAELRRMLNDRDANEWSTVEMLLRAGAEKHPGFQDLLARPELRKDPAMDMALCAYDYSVNGNHQALERILAWHREASTKGGAGWGNPAPRALAYVDEWDRVKQELESHPVIRGEGDGDPQYGFWLARRYLFPMSRDFPKEYERFVEDLGGEPEEN